MRRRPAALVIAGTRPECIKLAPLVQALAAAQRVRPMLGLTGQHRELMAPLLALFGLRPAFDLRLMRPGQHPASVLARAVEQLGPAVARLRPAVIIVQGDTTSALAGALAGFYAGVPVAHVEAGLRAPEDGAPHPEEGQRRLVGRIARWHFAPTPRAAAALRAEGVPGERVLVTGNTGIDALRWMLDRLEQSPAVRQRALAALPPLDPARPLVVATVHRRENRGARLRAICAGLRWIAAHEGAQLFVPVHPAPDIAPVLAEELGGVPGIALVAPPPYPAFVALLARARLLLSDSGGLQEEAPALGLPMLVLRDATERPEGIEAGTAALVGADPVRIAGYARAVLRDRAVAAWMGRRLDLHGDGRAAVRIADALAEDLAPAAAPVRARGLARAA